MIFNQDNVGSNPIGDAIFEMLGFVRATELSKTRRLSPNVSKRLQGSETELSSQAHNLQDSGFDSRLCYLKENG